MRNSVDEVTIFGLLVQFMLHNIYVNELKN